MKEGSRNSPCPCGSGKKSKECCLAREEECAQRRKAAVKTAWIVLAAGLVLAGAGWGVFATVRPGTHDALAKCLTGKGFVMYGAFWCGNCDRQKKAFGKSFRHVAYVECNPNGRDSLAPECGKEGIRRYPTWTTPDGDRMTGFIAPDALARASGCGT